MDVVVVCIYCVLWLYVIVGEQYQCMIIVVVIVVIGLYVLVQVFFGQQLLYEIKIVFVVLYVVVVLMCVFEEIGNFFVLVLGYVVLVCGEYIVYDLLYCLVLEDVVVVCLCQLVVGIVEDDVVMCYVVVGFQQMCFGYYFGMVVQGIIS